MADAAPINWTNAMTLISVAILVGTELVGAGAAAGWAIGGLFQLGETLTRTLEGVLILDRADRALLFSARGGRARADPRLAGRALAAKIASPDRRRRPWGCICAAENARSGAEWRNADGGAQSAKRAPGRFGRNADRSGRGHRRLLPPCARSVGTKPAACRGTDLDHRPAAARMFRRGAGRRRRSRGGAQDLSRPLFDEGSFRSYRL